MSVSEWSVIETAPRDGTEVLVCQALNADGEPFMGDSWGLFVQVAAWWSEEGDDGEWMVYCSLPSEPCLHFVPTHWMPVPPNPFAKGADEC